MEEKTDRKPKAAPRSAVGNGVFAFWALALLDGLHTLRVLIRSLLTSKYGKG